MRDAEVVGSADDHRDRWRKWAPQHPPEMWVRVEGRWRRGAVQVWFQDAAGRWYAWGRHGEPGFASRWELWVFDPETIRPRDGDEPPPDGETPAVSASK